MVRLNDQLTGLPNRRALDERLKETITPGSSTALAMLDLDGFLEVNTDHGDDVGDLLLQRLAALLEEFAPESVYRISGDEFALVLPETTLEQAFLRLERLRSTVAEAAERFALPDARRMTVSIGVAHAPRDANDARGLLRTAQAALQGAKESGRNQVALPPNEEMVMKTCYYPASSVRKLRTLAERLGRKESPLLREALDDLIRKYDVP